MKICSKCGERAEDSSMFCMKCGSLIEDIPVTQPPVVPPVPKRTCRKCRRSIPADVAFCPYCRTKILPICEVCGAEMMIKPDGTYFCKSCRDRERILQDPDPNTGSGGFVYAEGEKLVKSYRCAQLRSGSISGNLYVTNKRVLFKASGTEDFLTQEVKLDTITGLNCMMGKNINTRMILAGILFILIGSILGALINTVIIVIGIFIGLLLLWCSQVKTYRLSVFSSQAESAAIDIGAGVKSLAGNSAVLAVECEPTPEAKKMLKEVGALILDLQTRGDHAIDKWSKGAQS